MLLGKYYTMLMLLCAVSSMVAARECRADRLHVVRFYSGAAAKLSDGRKIVYSGISVPNKKNKPFFRECLNAHRQLVGDAPVIVMVQEGARGKDLRRLPVVAFCGRLLINAELIRQGYALAGRSDEGFRYRDLFLELQREASLAGRGLWAYKDTFSEPFYVGSRSGLEFHRPDCPRAKELLFEDRVILRTKDEALAAGYIQDWRCCPLFRAQANGTAGR
jgi:endonuclease YncB( thermonuclease family)